MAGPGNILIRVGADAGDAIRELRGINGPMSDVQTRGEKMSAGVRRAALPAAAALTAIGAGALSAAKAAAEDEAAATKLAGALKRTTGASDAQVSSAENYITKLSLQTAVADDELRPALARLASATGDVHTAQDRLALATDISAQSGKSLDVVTKALAAAEDGRTLALSKLVPGLDQATLKSKDMSAITAELADKVGGAASEAANTATGRYKLMQIQMGELQENLGQALIPVISKLSNALLTATNFASEHTTAVKAVVAVVAVLAAGVLAANAAMKVYQAGTVAVRVATAAYTAVQWLLNAALTANPIGAVIVAVVALTAAVIIAYQKSETFRNIVNSAWDVLKNVSPILIIITHFRTLSGAVEAVVGWIGKIHFPKVVGDAFDSLLSTVKEVVSWIGKIHFPKAPSWLHAPHIPFTAAPATAARALEPRRLSSSPRAAGPSSAGAGPILGDPNGIVINVFGATDPEGTARAIRRALRAHDRRQGALGSIASAAT